MSMTIKDAWLAAETTAFDQLVTRLASKSGFNAFRGYIPEDRDCWSLTTGGLAMGPIERFWGDSPAWCAIAMNARFTTRFQNRDNCLKTSGSLLAALQETTNFKAVGNIISFRLRDMPGEPQPVVLDGDMLIWVCEIPMELVFSTAEEFSTTT
jgi:hypothetical protein